MSEVVDEDVNVLFIEDDPAVAEMYKLKLELDGYRVTVAKSGEEGLDHAKNQVPDIVFLDIRLPKMDGFAVLENLRSDTVTKNIPVIILSNYGDSRMVSRGLQLGWMCYHDETYYKKISSLPAACNLTFRNGRTVVHHYWDIDLQKKYTCKNQ